MPKTKHYGPDFTVGDSTVEDLENAAPPDAPSSYSFRPPPLPPRAVSVAKALQPHNYPHPSASREGRRRPRSPGHAKPLVMMAETALPQTIHLAAHDQPSPQSPATSPTRAIDTTHERLQGLRRTQELLRRQSDTLSEMLANLDSHDVMSSRRHDPPLQSTPPRRRKSQLLMSPKEVAFKHLEGLRLELAHQGTLDASLPQPGHHGPFHEPTLTLVADDEQDGSRAAADANAGAALEAEGLEAEGLLNEGAASGGGRGPAPDDASSSDDGDSIPARVQDSLPSQTHLLKLLRSRYHNQEQVLTQRLAATRIINRWRKWLGRRSASHARAARATRAYEARLLRRSLVVLSTYAKLSAELKRAEHRAAMHHRKVAAAPVLQTWHAAAARRSAAKRRVAAARAHRVRCLNQLGVTRWTTSCSVWRRRRAAEGRADRAWDARLARFAIGEWVWFTDAAHAAAASRMHHRHSLRRWRRSAARTREEVASTARADEQSEFVLHRRGVRALVAAVAMGRATRRAQSSHARTLQRRTLRVWTRYWQGRVARGFTFATADTRFEAAATRRAVHVWVVYRRHQVATRRARAHFHSALMARVVKIWGDEVRDAKRDSRTTGWYLGRLKSRCFNVLAAYTEGRVDKSAREAVAHARWRQTSRQRGVDALCMHAEGRQLWKRAVAHDRSTRLYRSFQQWIDHHLQERCGAMAVSFFDGVQQRVFFWRWVHYCDSRREKRAMKERADAHWTRVARTQAIDVIMDHLAQTQSVRRAVRKFEALHKARFLHVWREGVAVSKDEGRASMLYAKHVSKRM